MTVVVASGVVVVNFVVIGVAGDQLDDDGVCLDDDEDGDDAHVGREGGMWGIGGCTGEGYVVHAEKGLVVMLMLVVRGNVGNRGLHRGRLCR